MRFTGVLALMLASAASTSRAASDAYGTVVAVEGVTWTSGPDEPPRVRVTGRFLGIAADGTPAATAQSGSVELVCPLGWHHECRTQAVLLTAAIESRGCVALGWAGAAIAPGPPQPWPLRATALPKEQSACVRARGLEPPAVPVSAPAPKMLPPAAKGPYGKYLLIVDAANLLTAPLYVGLVGYLVGAPSLHLSRGHYGRAAGSFGMRVALPTLGALTGALLVPPRCDREAAVCLPIGPVVGLGLGVVAAVVIDAALLGDDPAPPKATGLRLGPTGVYGVF